MSKIINTDIFIEMARKVHGDLYDYSCTKYCKSRQKVDIVCKIHGAFSQTPNSHLNGKGCKLCSDKTNGEKLRSNNTEFISKSIYIHGDKYDYSNVEYKTNSSLVEIICPIHGSFIQKAAVHLCGNGCFKCGIEKRANSSRSNLYEFIEKSNLIHKNKYSYELSEYTNARNKIKIICPIHGEFMQVPDRHVHGLGCPKCSRVENRYNENRFSLTKWIEMGESSSNFDSYKIYIIKCSSGLEEFIKIGRTYTTTKFRFGSNVFMPYQFEIIKEISGNPHHIFHLETKLKRICKELKYSVKIPFSGQYECFTPDCLELLKDYINKE